MPPPAAPSIAAKPTTAPPMPPPSVQTFVIDGVSWESYEAVTNALLDRNIRITYDRGRLEFMSKSYLHECLSRFFVQIILILTEELNVPRSTAGSTTLSKQLLERGIEPDESFYLANAHRVRGREQFDLTVDPPPDLSVEIDIARSSINRLGIYAALRIPEVWRFDGEQLEVRVLNSQGDYEIVAASRSFPMVPLSDIQSVLKRFNQVDEVTLMREFRQRIRSIAAKPPI
jgi:Uma2 family endonuclease